jgi:lysophospholipase L1-like esterase
MSRASRARRLARAAAYGGGGVSLLGLAGTAVIVAEAKLARRTVGTPFESAPRADGLYGRRYPGTPIRLAFLGDSSAAGLGVEWPRQTPGARLAVGLAEIAGRPVRLRTFAVVGAQSSHLQAQVEAALATRPPLDVAVIMIGANDVTHRVRPGVAVRHLESAVRTLIDAGVQVVVGTCPDLGTVEPIAQPLRWIARRWSRQLAAAQTIGVVEAGGTSVSLGNLLGKEFEASPAEFFSADRFHPSAAGYDAAVMALLPSVCSVLDVWPEEPPSEAEAAEEFARGEGVVPISHAAVRASDRPGTEVSGTEVSGARRGPRGRWARLRRRLGLPLPEAEEPAESNEPEEPEAPVGDGVPAPA